MGDYLITLSEEEERALLWDMLSIQEWLNNAIHNKARQCIDSIIDKHSDSNPRKLTESAKLKILKKVVIKSAVERQAEIPLESE